MSGQSSMNFSDRTILPQMRYPFSAKPSLLCLDSNGNTIRKFDFEECKKTYFVLFFFPMDFLADASEVLAFSAHLEEFKKNETKVIGVTQDSPYVIRHWTQKQEANGGFGKPLGFPVLSDKDQSLAQLMGVAQPHGFPCRASFIIDFVGDIRYMMIHESKLGRSVKDILRLSIAFR